MSKVAVVFWSGTGNTAQMASNVAEGAKSAGAEVSLFNISDGGFNASMIDTFDAIAFGCPSMGAEVLEETEMQPLFDECRGRLGGKRIALFGSYGWGDGEWMRNWEAECKAAGADMACDFVICNDAPDAQAKDECAALGRSLS